MHEETINYRNWGYLQDNNQKVLAKKIGGVSENFSQYFCNLFKKQLDFASTQLEIKCYFLKQSLKSPQLDSKGVRFQKFIAIFSDKHLERKQTFQKVAEKILRKTTIKQNDVKVTYVHLKQNQPFDKCSIVSCSFASIKFSQDIKNTISQYISKINTINLQDGLLDLISVLGQLKDITYYYPILTAFIIMHPYQNGDKIMPLIDQGISAHELRQIAQGCDKISIEELKEHASIDTDLKGSPHLEWFWECLEGFPLEDRAFLIQHWTGLPKIPAEGFKGMKLRIVQGRYGKRLFSQTYFNKLHLPKFISKQQTKDAIETAIALVKKGDSIIED